MSPLKKIVKRGHIYHVYYRRSGAYRFIGKNFSKLFITLIALGILAWAFNTFILDIGSITEYIFEHYNKLVILGSLFASEIALGILPPDLYIAWAKEFPHPWAMVALLGGLSYTGGVISYFLGTGLYRVPRIHDWVDLKFRNQFQQIRRYGGLLIFISALTPLPFPPVCVVAGVVRFPFRTFLIVALSRIIRFFLYAAVIFSVF
ncbi:MAG: VTT domain-containing protein [Bacteroidota bacterium]|nr:VTT domain-containing protein [Bacteroidota bacterium]MDX5405236.1 VTT domain-containing protein [Bacteroidota bacterium]MDX5429266.1 VTT domain-containing protein [Bacteroidota bacterium]MDX5448060.1 VTT domain-containing protein [Bacteroidota bacterium]MDX5506889.1 VTT domain-containing protein [Bacteroidota bacterium]